MTQTVEETKGIYSTFYDVLQNLREEFHKNGRYDDSNVKLDEIIKLVVISYFESKNSTNRFNLKYIEELAEKKFNSKKNIASALRYLFEEIARDPMFLNNDGTNIFGSNPTLNIQPTNNEFAIKLISEINKINFESLLNDEESSQFDLINEFFGHFVRDNFRNNKEDGQYMTPQEVVFPILDMVFSDIFREKSFRKKIINEKGNYKIMDPTCGVGTLLIEPLRYIQSFINKTNLEHHEKELIIKNLKKKGLIGQDKVDRMVRLSKINMMLFGANIENIYHGNSITNGSQLDNYNEEIDLIVTNPPFGAVHNLEDIKDDSRYSIINELAKEYKNIDSELIMLDRCINLLKPEGRLVIVLPDSVVSATGIYESFRKELLKICDIKAIIDLPSVTFAQAGTRTKCVIMYLQKKKTNSNKLFISICDDIGYDVRERKGVPVKIEQGSNTLIDIAKVYIESPKELMNSLYHIENEQPSCTLVSENGIINNFLTPNFYSAERIKTINLLNSINENEFEVKELGEIAQIENKSRKRLNTSEEVKHISLLHINPEITPSYITP